MRQRILHRLNFAFALDIPSSRGYIRRLISALTHHYRPCYRRQHQSHHALDPAIRHVTARSTVMHGHTSRIFLLILVMFPARYVEAQEDSSVVNFLPEGMVFPLFTADALAHRISLSHITHNRDWIGTIGGSIPLARIKISQIELQAGVAASTFNRLIISPGLTVYTIDYKVDFPLDLRRDAASFRLAFGHYSCHFADDGIELLGRRSIQYVKDYVFLGAAHEVPMVAGHGYVAAQWTYHNVPARDKQWLIQLGGEAIIHSVSPSLQIYCALDIKLKQEVSWASTQSYQLGLKLFEKGTRSLRLACTLRRGFDERGQFFDRREDATIISTFIDF